MSLENNEEGMKKTSIESEDQKDIPNNIKWKKKKKKKNKKNEVSRISNVIDKSFDPRKDMEEAEEVNEHNLVRIDFLIHYSLAMI